MISVFGISTNKWFFYWYDPIKNKQLRTVGYEKWSTFSAICFWYFCVCWGSNNDN